MDGDPAVERYVSGTVNVQRAAEILDEDHYDLEKVKERILDYLAVLQLKPVLKGTHPLFRRTAREWARPR